MDEARLRELERKRGEVGLSHEEANELGRLLAERAGKPYGNAENPPSDVEVERDAVVAEQQEEIEESRALRDVDDTIESRERRAAEQEDAPPPA